MYEYTISEIKKGHLKLCCVFIRRCVLKNYIEIVIKLVRKYYAFMLSKPYIKEKMYELNHTITNIETYQSSVRYYKIC